MPVPHVPFRPWDRGETDMRDDIRGILKKLSRQDSTDALPEHPLPQLSYGDEADRPPSPGESGDPSDGDRRAPISGFGIQGGDKRPFRP